ncbi:MAG: TraR/DksA C4-type zinc finger protein [Candidatus Paceibacterota bacterium]
MSELDINHFKEKLEKEQTRLEKELGTIGRVNPENPGDWEAKPEEADVVQGDSTDRGDFVEAYESNSAVLKELETQLVDVKHALKKIEDNKYGICEVCGEPIEAGRLEANSSARTCMEHKDTELEHSV